MAIAETVIGINGMRFGRVVAFVPEDESNDRHDRRSSTVG